MKKNIFLSVVISCFNEEKNIKRGVIEEMWRYMEKRKYPWEVIISMDGPTDETEKLVEISIKDKPGFRMLKNEHGGKPSGLWHGLKIAKGKYTLFTDMDQSTPLSELEKLLPYLKEGYGAVIGSRGMTRENYSWYRKLGARVFLTIRKFLILSDLNDTQCGFKLFETEVLKTFFPKLEFFHRKQNTAGWKVTSFDVELLFLLEKHGYKVKEVPVDWKDRDISTSKGDYGKRYMKESKEMLMQILRVKINDVLGKYGK
jgi:dolichyl-phosphate beta-glucosyltransferase